MPDTTPLVVSTQLFTAFILTFGRVIGVVSSMPVIGERVVPWQAKVGLSAALALLLMPASHAALPLPADSQTLLFLMFAREVVVGLCLGYLTRMIFGAFYFAVNLLDFQAGLSFAEVVNPGTDTNLAVMGQFLNTLLLLLFFELDGHHVVLRALALTIERIPLGTASPPVGGAELGTTLFANLVAVSLQMALPAVMVLLLIDVAFGLIGRFVPQLNVFLVALPVKILVCMATLSLTMPVLSSLLGRMLNVLGEALNRLTGMLS